jgi:GAF domain-containing protein/HAMP domain-containing protein
MTATDRPPTIEPAASDRRIAQESVRRRRLTFSLRVKSVINLVVLILAVVIVGVAGTLGLNSLNFEVDNLYNFMLIPIHTIDGANRTLSDVRGSYRYLASSQLSLQDIDTEIQLIRTLDNRFKAVLDRYHSEWVTTLSEPFTQMLEHNGQLGLQADEVTTLERVQTEFDSYLKQRDEAIPRILAGSASPAELQQLGSASNQIQIEMDHLVEVNIEFARVSFEDAVSSYHASVAAMIVTGVIVSLLGMGLLFILLRSIVRPLNALRRVADDITSGRTDTIAPVFTRDEIGLVATAFNTMTARLRDLIDSLETRVEMRTAQLRTSTDVGRAATSILDTNQLLREVVNLIAERFGFYYAAVFTLDDTGKWAVLREATGEAGRVLKERGHRLEIGGQSMVSTAMTTRHSRIALDVGDEAARFANPLLPETRSEVALPLIVGDRVLGALDVQSVQAAAFDETSTAVLQSMADQIAIALNNAAQYRREQSRAQQTTHLLEATAELTALGQTADLYNRIVELTSALLSADSAGLWQPLEEDELVFTYAIGGMESLVGQRVRSGEGIAGRVHATGLTVRLDDARTSMDAAIDLGELPVHAALAVPMIWQGRVIGVLIAVHSQGNRTFTSDDESLAQLLAAQAAAAIENIRLREQQQRTLDELNNLNRRLTGESWRAEVLGEALTHEYRPFGSAPIESTGLSLQIPIEVRGEPIGAITIEDERRRELSEDERSLIQGVVQQMSLALENQRLADIAQRTAQREKQIAQAADKIHRASDMESILRTAVEEVSRIVGVEEVGIQLGIDRPKPNGNGGQSAPSDVERLPTADAVALAPP